MRRQRKGWASTGSWLNIREEREGASACSSSLSYLSPSRWWRSVPLFDVSFSRSSPSSYIGRPLTLQGMSCPWRGVRERASDIRDSRSWRACNLSPDTSHQAGTKYKNIEASHSGNKEKLGCRWFFFSFMWSMMHFIYGRVFFFFTLKWKHKPVYSKIVTYRPADNINITLMENESEQIEQLSTDRNAAVFFYIFISDLFLNAAKCCSLPPVCLSLFFPLSLILCFSAHINWRLAEN